MSKQALGKGISALIPQPEDKTKDKADTVKYLQITEIKPNPYQPRKNPEEDLTDLVASIKQNGVLQPVMVRLRREVNTDAVNYELVVGERRLRASMQAGLTEIPVIIKDVTDIEMVEWALIENIQRSDLNIIEQALAFKRLMQDFSMTHEMIADKVGKERPTITNAMRLLTLPETIQNCLMQSKITPGHARALLALTNSKQQEEICQRIIQEGLSVRDTEKLCMPGVKTRTRITKIVTETISRDVHLVALEEKLQDYLRTRVRITKAVQRGNVSIEFYSDDDLTRLVNLITDNKDTL